MSLARFLHSLFAESRVRVPSTVNQQGTVLTPTTGDLADSLEILTEVEAEYRNELPGSPPSLSEPAMLWAALIVFRASSFLAYRDVNEEVIRLALDQNCPAPASPSVCYSVDLTLRFLPDLIRLAKAASESDPLVGMLTALARQWPLSSVGVANVGIVDVTGFVENDCLMRIYVDRIFAAKERSRMDAPPVREAIRAAIGLHPELAAELANELSSVHGH